VAGNAVELKDTQRTLLMEHKRSPAESRHRGSPHRYCVHSTEWMSPPTHSESQSGRTGFGRRPGVATVKHSWAFKGRQKAKSSMLNRNSHLETP
jgi:hypothetical protein